MPDNCCDCCGEYLCEDTHIQCLENNDKEEMTVCQTCWEDNEEDMRKEGWAPNDEPQQFCDEEDSNYICKCLFCDMRYGTAEDSCGWTQRERTFCSVTCEKMLPDWKCEEEAEEEEEA